MLDGQASKIVFEATCLGWGTLAWGEEVKTVCLATNKNSLRRLFRHKPSQEFFILVNYVLNSHYNCYFQGNNNAIQLTPKLRRL
ncbi:hypothetical protein MTP04_29840 [Lysinibacillus sp. PLM2]|nr:hypothetical protein MTP04_29840 [Lysinibacillus sp. PLM2]